MSERSFKRDRARADAAARRRERRRAKRATLATGAAIGATVVFAPAASAANFEVNSLTDGPADACDATCTIRDAVEQANTNSGVADTITFADGLSGTITLTEGQLEVLDEAGLTITDDGTNEVTISGDTSTRVFLVDSYVPLTINGLTLTDGAAIVESGTKYENAGGLIFTNYESELAVNDSQLTNSYAKYGGGGIFNLGGSVTITNSQINGNGATLGGGVRSSGFKYDGPGGFGGSGGDAAGVASVVITGSELTENEADTGGGVFTSGAKYEEQVTDTSLTTLDISDSTISGNSAGSGAGTFSKYSDTSISTSEFRGNEGQFAVAIAGFASDLQVDASEISGNFAGSGGAGIGMGKYGTLQLTGSQVTGNRAEYGTGIAFEEGSDSPFSGQEPGTSTIARSTIAGNVAYYSGAGVEIGDLAAGEDVTIESSTISGNRAENEVDDPTYGGGLSVYGDIAGDVLLSNSTVSGNSADFGGGVSFDGPYQAPEPDPGDGSRGDAIVGPGSVRLDNSTIAANRAALDGGGIYIGTYYAGAEPDPGDAENSVTVPLSSTIVADNTVGAGANDLAQSAEAAAPGSFRLTNSLVEAPGSATVTQNPAGSSLVGADPQLGALADNGGPTLTHLPSVTSPALDAGLANGLATDQRGLPRTVDVAAANGAGDGTDIGSVEVQSAPNPHVRALDRDEVPAGCPVPFDQAQLALAGDDTSQTIEGSPGDDILRGYGGDDTVLGVDGDDCLTGDSDNDVVKGGDGNDFAIGGFGADVVNGGKGDDEMRGAEDDDKIKLNGGDDKGVGGGGEDKVTGGGGDDAVRGRFGADKVDGQNGDDAVRGGGGNDLVKGGSGENSLRGGGGDDTIVLAKGSSNEVNCGKGDDVVKGATKDDSIAGNCETVK